MKTLLIGCAGLIGVIVVIVLLAAPLGSVILGNQSTQTLTDNLSTPLGDATTAKLDISTSSGNLSIDRIAGQEPVLANGTLQYLPNQGAPTHSIVSKDGEARFTLRGGEGGQPWFHLPWEDCNGATEWQIHLNPAVSSDITAHSGGGNVKLNLAGMTVTRLSADTGGGNLDVVLPDAATNLGVTAKTGAGNVTIKVGANLKGLHTVVANSGAGNVVVRVPSGLAAKIHAKGGIGKVIVDSRFQSDGTTYQSPEYDGAADRIEITVSSGAGNVSVVTD